MSNLTEGTDGDQTETFFYVPGKINNQDFCINVNNLEDYSSLMSDNDFFVANTFSLVEKGDLPLDDPPVRTIKRIVGADLQVLYHSENQPAATNGSIVPQGSGTSQTVETKQSKSEVTKSSDGPSDVPKILPPFKEVLENKLPNQWKHLDEFNEETDKFILEKSIVYGQEKQYERKQNQMWVRISNELFEACGLNRTDQQCRNRLTVLRRNMKKALKEAKSKHKQKKGKKNKKKDKKKKKNKKAHEHTCSCSQKKKKKKKESKKKRGKKRKPETSTSSSSSDSEEKENRTKTQSKKRKLDEPSPSMSLGKKHRWTVPEAMIEHAKIRAKASAKNGKKMDKLIEVQQKALGQADTSSSSASSFSSSSSSSSTSSSSPSSDSD